MQTLDFNEFCQSVSLPSWPDPYNPEYGSRVAQWLERYYLLLDHDPGMVPEWVKSWVSTTSSVAMHSDHLPPPSCDGRTLLLNAAPNAQQIVRMVLQRGNDVFVCTNEGMHPCRYYACNEHNLYTEDYEGGIMAFPLKTVIRIEEQ